LGERLKARPTRTDLGHMTASRRRFQILGLAIAGLLMMAATSAVPMAAGPPRPNQPAFMTGVPSNSEAEEPAPAPPPAAPGVEAPAPPPAAAPTVAELCRNALTTVAEGGLRLPARIEYRCPSTQFAHHGAACYDWGPCAGGGFIAINMDLIGPAGDAYLAHVVAHEICHIYDFLRTGRTSEPGADACAAAYGFPA
jgi:hypothetical protein